MQTIKNEVRHYILENFLMGQGGDDLAELGVA